MNRVVKRMKTQNRLGNKLLLIKQGVSLKNATLLQPNWKNEQYSKQSLIINYELFLEHREEILIMKESLVLIKNLTENEMTI